MKRLARAVRRSILPFSLRTLLVRWRDGGRFRREAPKYDLRRGDTSLFSSIIAERSSPLRRPGTTYSEELQKGKEANVARAAELITGTVVPPGCEFSYHHAVGPPTLQRGFVMGAELHDDRLEAGIGGGACQASNLLYVLALLSGCQITQRHRHGFDLFPDSERTVPFGCGATVYFPSKDLRFINCLDQDLCIELVLEDGQLVGRFRTVQPVNKTWSLAEAEASLQQEGDRWIRRNKVLRIATEGSQSFPPEVVAENCAICLYNPEEPHESSR